MRRLMIQNCGQSHKTTRTTQRVAHLTKVIIVQQRPILCSVRRPAVRVPYLSQNSGVSSFSMLFLIMNTILKIAMTRKGVLKSANTELLILTSESKLSQKRLSKKFYAVEVDYGGDSYSLELLNKKPKWKVPEDLFSEFLTHPVETKWLTAKGLPRKIKSDRFEKPVNNRECNKDGDENES